MPDTETDVVNVVSEVIIGTRYPAHRKMLLEAMQHEYGDKTLSDTIRRCLDNEIVRWLEASNG